MGKTAKLKRKLKKIYGITAGSAFILIVLMFVSAPIINNHNAKKIAKEIKKVELPPGTTYIESFSKADKIVGNGNGIQYLGGILIRSDQPIEELKNYYHAYAKKDWEFLVESQVGNTLILEGEITRLKLKSEVNGEHYYIVYSWGDPSPLLMELDFTRGH